MSGGQNNEKEDLNTAYAGVHDGVTGNIAGGAVFARYVWNWQMGLLKSIGLMPFFAKNWWLFLVVGFLLLAFVVPLGVAFVVTAFAAGQMDPKAADDFIVPLRQEPPDFGEDK